MTKLGHKITRLYVQNIQRVKMVEIIPKGNVVELAGENRQGKSSILDAIKYVLGGKEEIPLKPVRAGEKTAKILLETDEFTAIRTWTDEDRSYLTISANQGKSPQTFLDERIARISFEPVRFLRMKPKEQEAMLRQAVGLDTGDLEETRLKLYEARKTVGYEVKRLEVFRRELGEPTYGLPDKEESAQELIDRISQISEKTDLRNRLVSKIATLHGEKKTTADRIAIKLEQIKQLQQEISVMETAQVQNQLRIDTMQKEINSIVVEDITPLRGDLKVIEEKNVLIRKNQQISVAQNELDDKKVEYESYTGEIHDVDQAIQEKILNTTFPIEYLTVGEEGIIYRGIPLQQASQAESVLVSLVIAEAMNKDLQIILIKEGSLLDKESMKFVRQYAKEKDCQIWVERVEPTDKDAIIIEDGGVVVQ